MALNTDTVPSATLINDEGDSAGRDIRKTAINPDYWFPVARSGEVRVGKPFPVAFAGRPIVLVRTRKRSLYALEDKCAHRQIPLHLGVIENDCIKCAYHGWKFNETGRCVGVPYLEKCSLRPRNVPDFPCREAYGLIFVYPGSPENVARAAFPVIPNATNPKYKIRYLDRLVQCHYTFMHENLMDMNHQFLHRRLMGGVRTTLLEVRKGDSWVEADYTFSRDSDKQPLGERLMIGNVGKFEAGTRDLMTVRTMYPYQILTFTSRGATAPALDLWVAYVPRDKAQRTNHTYGMMMIRRPSIPVVLDLLWPIIIWFTNGIFREDQRICELEQEAFEDQGADANHEIFPVIRALRRILINNGRSLS
jgi:phenylpropionate dioxygenase-like ring-hydroxylating dioxygenase large terminal subunit